MPNQLPAATAPGSATLATVVFPASTPACCTNVIAAGGGAVTVTGTPLLGVPLTVTTTLPLVAPVPGRRMLRVVSHPLKPKGKLECFGCGDDGRIRVRRLSRERSDSNRPFERARRGDVLLLSGDGGFGASLLRDMVGTKKAKEIWMLCRQYDAG